MRKKFFTGLMLAGVVTVVLSGCSGEAETAFPDAETAKTALDDADSVCFEGHYKDVNQKGNVLADGKVAGYMEESGFLNTRWTITIDGQTWFYVKIVTDEWINEDTQEYVSAATYGYYDENDNCLGYAQERAWKGSDDHSYYFCYLDADGNAKDYYSDEYGYCTWDADGNQIATGDYEVAWTGDDYQVQIDMEEGCGTQIDFMDKTALYIKLYDELYDRYRD